MLDEERFLTILDAEIDDARQYQEEVLNPDRERNYAYYLGLNTHPAPLSRSQAISWDVFEVVETTLPDLIEIFLGNDEIARYEPVGEEDTDFAEQATDYINYIVKKQNNGFLLFNTWLKDALLSKIGVVRAYWAEEEKAITRRYRAVNEMQLTAMLDEEGTEVVEQEASDDESEIQKRREIEASLNVLAPEQQMQAVAYLQSPLPKLYDVTIRQTRKRGRVYIDNIQPENFFFSRRAKSIESADLVGELKVMTRSDMIEAGYKKSDVEEVESWDGVRAQDMGIAQEADDYQASQIDNSYDRANQEIVVFDGFVRVDYRESGTAEWRHVVRAGNKLLVNEDSEGPDFVVMSPILIPHRLAGMALADPVAPLQTVNTALTRQYIDSLVMANNPRTYVNTDAKVNLDDLLNNQIGGIVRGSGPAQNAVSPLVTSNVATPAIQGIEFMDSRREQRTGITRYNQGLDADSLNKTATGVSKIMDAGNARKKMMARILAETGIKDLFRLLLNIVVNNQDRPATIRLRNRWVQFDPSGWSPEMDVSIETGLGTGDKSATLSTLSMVLDTQKEALAAGIPLATPKNLYNTLESMLKTAGIKGVARYFQDPDSLPPPDPNAQPPEEESPEAALAAAQVKSAEIKAQSDMRRMQLDAQLKQMEFQQKAEERQQDIAIAMQKHQSDLEIERVKLQQEEVRLETARLNLQLKEAEIANKAYIAERDQDRKDFEASAKLAGDLNGNL